MSSFQYYLPRGKEQTAEKCAAAAGLAYVLAIGQDDADMFACDCQSGPDDGRGVIVRLDSGCRYKPDRQHWVEHPQADYWIGYDPEDPPGPEDMEGPRPIAKYTVRLGDGNWWMIPTAAGRNPDDCPLPKDLGMDPETGQITRRPLKRFDQLRLYAAEVHEIALRQNQMDIDDERTFHICREALRTNYRIDTMEISLLHLLTEDAIAVLLKTLIDLRTWPEHDAQDEEIEETPTQDAEE